MEYAIALDVVGGKMWLVWNGQTGDRRFTMHKEYAERYASFEAAYAARRDMLDRLEVIAPGHVEMIRENSYVLTID